MSKNLLKPYNDPHSQTFCKEEGLQQNPLCTNLKITSDIPSYIRAQKLTKGVLNDELFGSYQANSQHVRKRNRSSMLILATNKTMKSSEGDAEDHFLNDDFETKYKKYSAVLVHERNAFRAILSRNQNDIPLFSNTATQSFLITNRTGVDNLSNGDQIVHESIRNGGVKIQPLWSNTDSEKDNLGDAPASKGDRSCDSSDETDTMDDVAVSNKYDVSVFAGMFSSPSLKEDKAGGNSPVTEMPDTGSMGHMEISTSKTQSLEAEHLQEQNNRSVKECALQEPSGSSWVKRLHPSSSEVGEYSSHLSKKRSLDKELLISDQSMMGPAMKKGECMLIKSKDTIFQSSWIQRWCQDHTVAKLGPIHSKCDGVICEPESSKLVLDEAEKKQFPSIAAMALMGKSMNGLRPCKFTKRGPLVVWNTNDN